MDESKTTAQAILAVELQTLETLVAMQAAVTSLAKQLPLDMRVETASHLQDSQKSLTGLLNAVKELVATLKRQEEAGK